jgi:hypothetical protein
MEGECYALIYGITYIKQHLHWNHFIIRIDHKPIKWLTIESTSHGRRGEWINLLKDFKFKIIQFEDIKLKNIFMCEFFYRITVAIKDHYLK